MSRHDRQSRRYWCDYRDLEEYRAGMWKRSTGAEARQRFTARGAAFLRDSPAFRAGMRRVLAEWHTSCLYNFTNPSLNRPVWLAHAAAALLLGISEECMRLAYWELSQAEREQADKDATEIYAEWKDPRESDGT